MTDGLGDRHRKARLQRGLTTNEYAAQMGVTTQTLWAWETNRTRPTERHLIKAAKVLDVDIFWLIDGHNEP